MPVSIKCYPPSWIQINTHNKLIFIDPAYLKTHFKDYPKRIEFSSFIPEMQGLGQEDVALLPVGGTFTMDIDEAVEAAITMNPKVVIPIHRFKADLQKLAEAIGIRSAINLIPQDLGEAYSLQDAC